MPIRLDRLLVPVNGTEGDERVLSTIAKMIQRESVHLTLMHVIEVKQSMPLDAELPGEIERGESILKRAEDIARRKGGLRADAVLTELIQARSAGAAIVDEALERKSDAIIMAARNHQRLGKTTLGETVGYVLKNAECEVFLIRMNPRGSSR